MDNVNLPKRSFKLPFNYPLSQHFKKFSQLPPAVQKMVWTEFYHNPRYFVAKWAQWCELIKHDQDDGKQDDNKADDSDEGCSVEDNYDEYEPEADDSSLMSVSNYFVHHSGWELEPIRTKAHTTTTRSTTPSTRCLGMLPRASDQAFGSPYGHVPQEIILASGQTHHLTAELQRTPLSTSSQTSSTSKRRDGLRHRRW